MQLQAGELSQFHHTYYGHPTLVVVGNVELSAASAQRLSGSAGAAAGDQHHLGAAAAGSGAAGAVQSRRGDPGRSAGRCSPSCGSPTSPGPGDPSRTVADVANMLLGGVFTSRQQNLREQHGYSYGAQSGFNRLSNSGWFAAQAAVRSDVTAESLAETLWELVRLRNEPVSPPPS